MALFKWIWFLQANVRRNIILDFETIIAEVENGKGYGTFKEEQEFFSGRSCTYGCIKWQEIVLEKQSRSSQESFYVLYKPVLI